MMWEKKENLYGSRMTGAQIQTSALKREGTRCCFIAVMIVIFALLCSHNVHASETGITGIKQVSAANDWVKIKWNDKKRENCYDLYISEKWNGKYEEIYFDSEKDNRRSALFYLPGDKAKYYIKLQAYYFDDRGLKNFEPMTKAFVVDRAPETVEGLYQSGADKKNAYIKWNPAKYATDYQIKYIDNRSRKEMTKTVRGTSAWIPSNGDTVEVLAVRKGKHFTAHASQSAEITTKFIPEIKNIKLVTPNDTPSIDWDHVTVGSGGGFEYEIYKYGKSKCFHKGKMIVSNYIRNYISLPDSTMMGDSFYGIRVRGYIYIGKNGKTKKYGSWSDKFWFGTNEKDVHFKYGPKGTKSKGKLKLSWKKVNGATSYNILVSTSYPGKISKMKKVASTKKLSYTLKKFGKKAISKKKHYYVAIQAVCKIKGKTYKTLPTRARYF